MLIFSCLVATFTLNLSFCTSTEGLQIQNSNKSRDAHTVFSSVNRTQRKFVDTPHNIIVFPSNLGKINMASSKRRNIKKSPKRTIQKIIKQARRSRKTFLNKMTSLATTTVPTTTEMTTATAQKKKTKKWNSKFNRNQLLPFQRTAHHRQKREEKKDRDVYILQDLDEVEFLSNEDGMNTIKAHVKKYW